MGDWLEILILEFLEGLEMDWNLVVLKYEVNVELVNVVGVKFVIVSRGEREIVSERFEKIFCC